MFAFGFSMFCVGFIASGIRYNIDNVALEEALIFSGLAAMWFIIAIVEFRKIMRSNQNGKC
jgi:hypothetical protein